MLMSPLLPFEVLVFGSLGLQSRKHLLADSSSSLGTIMLFVSSENSCFAKVTKQNCEIPGHPTAVADRIPNFYHCSLEPQL